MFIHLEISKDEDDDTMKINNKFTIIFLNNTIFHFVITPKCAHEERASFIYFIFLKKQKKIDTNLFIKNIY